MLSVNIQCVECGNDIRLSEADYSYKGNIRCPECKALLEV